MLQRIKNRSTVTTWLVIVGFAISMTTILEGIGILDSVLRANAAVNNYAYSSQLHVTINGNKNTVWDIDELLYGVNGLIVITGVNMYFDEIEEMGTCSWFTLVNSDEPLKYSLKWGRIPDVMKSNREVALPDFMEKHLITSDSGQYIFIQGLPYKVVGIFDTSKNSNAYAFVISHKSLPTDIRDDIFSSYSVTLAIYSDRINAYDAVQTIKDNISKYSYNATVSTREIKMDIPIFQTMANSGISLFFLLYLFSIINSMVATNFWIITKRRDMSIRKAFGWSNKDLTFLTISEMIVNITVGGLFSVFMIAFFSLLYPTYFAISVTPLFLISTFGLLLLTLFFSIAIPFVRIINLKPAEGVA